MSPGGGLRWRGMPQTLRVTIKNIEKELICPACKELFTHPLILPCQHSVCHKCVKELLLSLDDSFNDVASDSSNQSSPRLRLTSPSMDKIDKINRPEILMCPEHETERINMYCELCRRPVCHLCKLGGNHSNHRVTTMSSAYKTLKEKLSKDIDYLIGKESQVKSQISELNLLMKETECNGERAKEEALAHFEKLFEILEDRKSSVLKAIDASKKLRLDKFHTQMEEYQGLLENNGLVGYAQEVLKETDQSCFVQTAKQLHLRIQKATESLKSFRPAAQASFEDYVVNISKQTEVLGELSFFSSGIDIPEINEEQSKVYNNALIDWHHPEKDKADSYVLEYRRINRDEEMISWNEIEVHGTSKVVSNLESNSPYAFRVELTGVLSAAPAAEN
ncbi:RING-type E3 ubiquitin transferase [Apodemus speciosus]|uniref:RING-type E3 ubiquitin transferase n=1 Tax=Apodemus speciosus TaxID=105296 RepID=A0ABQ0FR34_APOSI